LWYLHVGPVNVHAHCKANRLGIALTNKATSFLNLQAGPLLHTPYWAL